MPRAHRHYIPGCVWHITHRCHKQEFLLRFEKDRTFILHGIQISPDKNVNFPCAAAPFTVSPAPWASTCCAALPGDSALYDVSVRQLASSESPASLTCTPASFRPHLTVAPLPSASNFVTFHNVTWNTYRGL